MSISFELLREIHNRCDRLGCVAFGTGLIWASAAVKIVEQEEAQPWKFPLGTKEIRYYLQRNSCIYLIGGRFAWLSGLGPTGGNPRRAV